MLADIRYWENDATNKHYAIAHFNVWNAEMLMGVIDAAEEAKSPVIISFGTGFVGNTSFEDFSHMMVSMARKATVPVITHWDHGRSMGNDSNLLIVFYVQIMPDDFVMQLHRF